MKGKIFEKNWFGPFYINCEFELNPILRQKLCSLFKVQAFLTVFSFSILLVKYFLLFKHPLEL